MEKVVRYSRVCAIIWCHYQRPNRNKNVITWPLTSWEKEEAILENSGHSLCPIRGHFQCCSFRKVLFLIQTYFFFRLPSSHGAKWLLFCPWSAILLTAKTRKKDISKRSKARVQDEDLSRFSEGSHCEPNVHVLGFFWSTLSDIRPKYGACCMILVVGDGKTTWNLEIKAFLAMFLEYKKSSGSKIASLQRRKVVFFPSCLFL